MRTLLLSLILLLAVPCYGDTLSIEQVMQSACRIQVQRSQGGRYQAINFGSGGTIDEDEDNYYILTCGHIFYGNSKELFTGPIYVEYYDKGQSLGKVLAKVALLQYSNNDNDGLDLALLAVAKAQMKNKPTIIKLENPAFRVALGTEVFTVSSPMASNPRFCKCRIVEANQYQYTVNTSYIDGDSGSLLMGNFQVNGESHTSVIGINIQRRQSDNAGISVSLQRIFQILQQNSLVKIQHVEENILCEHTDDTICQCGLPKTLHIRVLKEINGINQDWYSCPICQDKNCKLYHKNFAIHVQHGYITPQSCGPGGCFPTLPRWNIFPHRQPQQPQNTVPAPKLDHYGKSKSNTQPEGSNTTPQAPKVTPSTDEAPPPPQATPLLETLKSKITLLENEKKQLEEKLLNSESAQLSLQKEVERERARAKELQIQFDTLNTKLADVSSKFNSTTKQINDYKQRLEQDRLDLIAKGEEVIEARKDAGKHPWDDATGGLGNKAENIASGLIGAAILAGSVAFLGPAAGPVARILTPIATKIVVKGGKRIVDDVVGGIRKKSDHNQTPVQQPDNLQYNDLPILPQNNVGQFPQNPEKAEKSTEKMSVQDYNNVRTTYKTTVEPMNVKVDQFIPQPYTDTSSVEPQQVRQQEKPPEPQPIKIVGELNHTGTINHAGVINNKLVKPEGVPDSVFQLFQHKNETEDIRKYAIFAVLYVEAIERLKKGLFNYKQGVKLQGQEAIARAIENYVKQELMTRITIDSVKIDNAFYFEALKGFLYQEAVQYLRQGKFGVLGAVEAANAIDAYVEEQFLIKMKIL